MKAEKIDSKKNEQISKFVEILDGNEKIQWEMR